MRRKGRIIARLLQDSTLIFARSLGQAFSTPESYSQKHYKNHRGFGKGLGFYLFQWLAGGARRKNKNIGVLFLTFSAPPKIKKPARTGRAWFLRFSSIRPWSKITRSKEIRTGRVMFLAQYEWCIWSGWAVALAARVKNRSAPGRAMFLR